jgi:hypothetical protein
MSSSSVKEFSEAVKAIIEFLGSPKRLAVVFLACAIWLFPPARRVFPVHGGIGDYADLTATVCFMLSGAGLLVEGLFRFSQVAVRCSRAPERGLKKAIRRATPLEKLLLEAVIHMGRWELGLDPGSPEAMHLQEIGLIAKATGLPHTTYQLSKGLADLCIKTPALLKVSGAEESKALSDIEELRRSGLHKRFFANIAGPSSTSWMA